MASAAWYGIDASRLSHSHADFAHLGFGEHHYNIRRPLIKLQTGFSLCPSQPGHSMNWDKPRMFRRRDPVRYEILGKSSRWIGFSLNEPLVAIGRDEDRLDVRVKIELSEEFHAKKSGVISRGRK